MEILNTEIAEVKIVKPQVFGDNRGWFYESYNYEKLKELGIDTHFVQDNRSYSKEKGTLRGIHFQKTPMAQTKLITCTKGKILDVAVDLREGSATYGKWFGVILSAENKKQFFIPKNFAHGFLVLSDYAEFAYKCTDFYHPNDEGGLLWSDPDIGVKWPLEEGVELTISEKDQKWSGIKAYTEGKLKNE